MLKTKDLLPAQSKKGNGLAFMVAVARKNQAPKKAQFSVPKMKQVAKLAKSLGQEVTGFTVNGDGGFTVTTGIIAAAQPNEWD